jgi:hypothetical protein
MYYVTGRNYSYMKINGVSWFFLVCIVLPNLVFIVYWVLSMRHEVLKTVWRIHKEKNMKPWTFKVLAFMSSEAFYERYIKEDEIMAEKNKQIIIDDEEDGEGTDKETVKLEQIGIEVDRQDKTNYDDVTVNATIDDLIKQPQSEQYLSGRKSRRNRAAKYREISDPTSKEWDNFYNTPNTARSHKVVPEETIPNTAREEEFTNLNDH